MAQKPPTEKGSKDPESESPEPSTPKISPAQAVALITKTLEAHDKEAQRRILCATCALLDIEADFDELNDEPDKA